MPKTGNHKSRLTSDHDWVDAQTSKSESISLTQGEEPSAHPKPAEIDQAYHEVEHDELASEQVRAFTALGELEARPATVTAEGLTLPAAVTEEAVRVARTIFEDAKAHLALARAALQPFTRRSPHADFKYWVTWVLLLLGDVAGVSGAAILLGEVPQLAVLQALASAIAAVTAGLVGHDVAVARHARRRERDPQALAPEHAIFGYLFTGADSGERIVKALLYAALTIGLLLFGAIFALRTGVEGPLNGVVFGFLAAAICAASALNAYHFADEISDLLSAAYKEYVRALRRLTEIATSKVLIERAEAAATAASIKAEYAERGAAAEHKINSLKAAVSRQNPHVMGHGTRPTGLAASLPTQPSLFNDLKSTVDLSQVNGSLS